MRRIRLITNQQIVAFCKIIQMTHLDQPGEELAILHEGVPMAQVPIHILQRRDGLHAHPTQQDHDAARVRRDESQHERVLRSAVVALEDGVPQRALRVELDLVRPAPDQVVDEVGSSPPRADGVAEPLVRLDAPRDGRRVVDAAVPARVGGERRLVVVVDVPVVGQDGLLVEGGAGDVLPGVLGAD